MKHVVALSGGKDSTALALWLVENEPRDYVFVCTPTGDELPDMIQHWIDLGKRLGSRILPVTAGKGLSALIRAQVMLPNHRARWCTRMLKLEPYYRWLAQQAPAVSYVGLRYDEAERQGMIFPSDNRITTRFPLREQGFTEQDVWSFLDERGVTIPARTDCARCYHQTLGEWWRLWKLHPDVFEDAMLEEEWVSKQRGKQFTFRNKSRDRWPAALRALRGEFEKGRVPPRTVQQIDLFKGERRGSGICRVCTL